MSEHECFMLGALELARNGFAAPNPHVGCVIVSNGEIVGEGHSDPAGGAHAEVNALRAAGDRANGATVYVTLEPCNHQGRTGPCSEALIRAGVAAVHYAVADPNPVAVGGAERLREAGIEVHAGLLRQEAMLVHQQFLYSHHVERPFVTIKAGVSLDGRIATASGESKWITGEASRKDAQALRAHRGAVVVGRRTAQVDRARLTVREHEVGNQPARIVIDPRGILPDDLPIFDDQAPSMRFTKQPVRPYDRQFSDIPNLLTQLYQEGIRGVLVEGGANTISHFLRAGVVDEIVLYIAPILIGDGPTWLGKFGLTSLGQAEQFELVSTEAFSRVDDIHKDLKITYRSRNLSAYLTSN